jgi:hypothetical protein
MPKYRQLHLKIIDSFDFNEMPDDFTRVVWLLLTLILDSEGRGIYNMAWVKSRMFPLREDVTEDQLHNAFNWLEDRGMIVVYSIKDRIFFYLPTFKNYQTGTDKEAKSSIPAPELLQSNSITTTELLQPPVLHCIESALNVESELNCIDETPEKVNWGPTLTASWHAWDVQVIIARSRGKPELVDKYIPPPDSDWKTIDDKTYHLKFELSKVPK